MLLQEFSREAETEEHIVYAAKVKEFPPDTYLHTLKIATDNDVVIEKAKIIFDYDSSAFNK